MNIEHLVRPNILQLKPYSSARSEFKATAEIFLDANENPYNSLQYNRYPDPLQWTLKQKIAIIKKTKPEQIFCGNGSDEAIDVLLRIFCEPQQDNIITMPPTYGIYKVYANIANVQVVEVPLNADFSLNTKAILSSTNKHSKILFINNPNNPTGNLFAKKDIITLLQNFKGIVVIDEAYIDFANSNSMINAIKKYPNLVVLQTFSKALGLAGLRIGTAFASTEIIALINKVKAPYNINSFTQTMALKALNNKPKTDALIQKIIIQKKALIPKLQQLHFIQKIYHSETNYILIKANNADKLYAHLIKHQIVVRNRSKEIHCENCLRISIGTTQENKKFLQAMANFIE